MLIYVQPVVLSVNYGCYAVSIMSASNITIYSRLN